MPIVAYTSSQSLPNDKISVAVSIAPYGDIVRQIGGQNVDVSVLVPLGRTPHDYEPSPRLMASISRADVYFSCGTGLDVEIQYLDKILAQNKNLLHFDLSQNIEYVFVSEDHTEEYTPDPHVWTSLKNAVIIAQNVYLYLCQMDSANSHYYAKNYNEFCEKIDQLQEQIFELFSQTSKDTFLIYHGSFIYFANEFGLKQIAIKKEGKEVTPAHLASVIDQVRENNLKTVYVEREFSLSIAQVVSKDINGNLSYLDAISDNYLKAMWQNALALYEGLK